MTRTIQFCLALVAVLAIAAVAASLASNGGSGSSAEAEPTASPRPSAPSGDVQVVRADSHRLGRRASTEVTFTEFLDFECESCRAAFPLVEQLREDYAGKVTFVIRYFPIPSHRNAMNAAVAVEAAAKQGALEPMYQRMYETQSEWGEQSASKASLFRSYAKRLGLDVAAFDRAVADPATKRRVERDRDEGIVLGVEGTPTFFLNSAKIEPSSVEDLRAQIDAALQAE